ncbi:MAG: polyphosphate kinase 2 family protein [Dysgonamonadaceae bacterium]|nr:polyphosphate kinase 2 family protein [Dysgonamonadaceae bacterium]MDD4727385.1 polyphosphate kinase 2 family protein [Dysgonamonadaceae bacterium]
MNFNLTQLKVSENTSVNLKDFSTDESGGFDKKSAKGEIKSNIKDLKKIQRVFYADDRFSLLIVLQASDTAGKDGVIRHVMSGINPQGCRVHSFKTPSKEELDHDYLWRHYKVLPERRMIEIFNRSHYENVLVTKVNPSFLLNENLPRIDSVDKVDGEFWQNRYEQINNFEKHLYQNGTHILKFFLHISKDEQKERLLSRLDNPDKNWKFNTADLSAREQWTQYQKAYEEMLENTSREYAPWYVIPADKKFFARVAVGNIILNKLQSLNLRYPAGESDNILTKAREQLLGEE